MCFFKNLENILKNPVATLHTLRIAEDILKISGWLRVNHDNSRYFIIIISSYVIFLSGWPLIPEKSGIWEILEKTWNIEQKSLKSLEF